MPDEDLAGHKVDRHMFLTLFQIYRYWKLGIDSRYVTQMKGNIDNVQRAFADYLSLSEDSIKKVRLELDRLLL